MEISVVGHGGAEETEPDQHVTGQFFGPEQRGVYNIATKYLHRNDQRHGKAKAEEQVFDGLIKKGAKFLQGSQHRLVRNFWH